MGTRIQERRCRTVYRMGSDGSGADCIGRIACEGGLTCVGTVLWCEEILVTWCPEWNTAGEIWQNVVGIQENCWHEC